MFDTDINPVNRLAAGVRELAAEDRDGWSAAARSEHLLELLALRERVEAEVLRALGEWDATGAWAEDGALSPTAWLAHRAEVTRVDASTLVRTARVVRSSDRTAKSLAAGDLSATNATTLARAVRHREAAFDARPDVLIDAAETCSPEEFRRVARVWQCLADDHLDRTAPEHQADRWHLHASTTFGGAVAINGLLDPEGGATFLVGLRAHDTGPDPTHGDTPARTLPQRYADALVRMASGDERPRVNLDVVVDLATATDRTPTDLGSVRRDLNGVGPLDRETFRRLTCDCTVGRVIVRGKTEILDLGRRVDLATPAQRRALAIRDGGCIEPGCTAPPEWCDAHHRWHWIDGGPTDLDNLELRCRRHHTAAHEHDHTHGPRPPPHEAAA